MNFLAHSFLAAPDVGLIVGGLAADFLSGPEAARLPRPIRDGVWLHRSIDAFTDAHPAVRQGARLFTPPVHRYGSVLIDIVFDHCLARTWHRWSDEPLEAFADRVYGLLPEHVGALPPNFRMMSERMVGQRWFTAYATREGLGLAVERLGRRTRRPMDFRPAMEDVERSEACFFQAFEEFFPELLRHVQAEKIRLASAGD